MFSVPLGFCSVLKNSSHTNWFEQLFVACKLLLLSLMLTQHCPYRRKQSQHMLRLYNLDKAIVIRYNIPFDLFPRVFT